jgi:hypothetical protein
MTTLPLDIDKLKNQYKVTLILWFAMVVSVIIYLGIGLFFLKTGRSGNSTDFKFIFYLLSVISILLARFFKSLFLSEERISSAVSKGVHNLGGFLLASYIATFAFCESIAVYGLIMCILWGAESDFYILMAISMASFILNYPRFDFWQEAYRKAMVFRGGQS